MPRCVACDYCDTVGEMSPYKWGLTILEYSGRFVLDTQTGDEYCLPCYINVFDLYDDELSKENSYGDNELGTVGGACVDDLVPEEAGCDEETDGESGS